MTSQFSGEFRVLNAESRRSASQVEYRVVKLADSTTTCTGYAWPARAPFVRLKRGDVVHVSGRPLAGLPLRSFDVRSITVLARPSGPVADLIPSALGKNGEAVTRLRALIRQVQIPALARFLDAVLGDSALLLRLLDAPASRSFHHSRPGGLLEHIVEAAEWALRFPLALTRCERELCVVALLLHDVAKVRLREPRDALLASHDELVLEALAVALAQLDQDWPSGARLLRHMLTYRPGRFYRRPVHPAALIVRALDNLSAKYDEYRSALAQAVPTSDWVYSGPTRRREAWYRLEPPPGCAPLASCPLPPHSTAFH